MVVLPEAGVDMEELQSDEGRAEDPFRRVELAESGPLGKPLHGNESERSFFLFSRQHCTKKKEFQSSPDPIFDILLHR
ncbi:hypothetical protein [Alkalicoccus saliphilus]|uniref:Uncharacterized protein n=1 Tax=Alkalicoccus saliphilus TaxID=200989 RepID=A0A2T4U725_9BACI|nr:hypothetical protein [Alkalicoccus saliphilus]PTL39217.1 hypothetical protein C6Y45_07445 [Alkalicoccus saliphilus]